MDRIIDITVSGYHLTKSSKNAGVLGEANVSSLRITFDENWSGFAKSVTFWDALGEEYVIVNLTADKLEDITKSLLTYIVQIPLEACTKAGMMTFVIDGYIDGKRQRSISDKLLVHDAPFIESPHQPTDPTPSQAEQLQEEIDGILGTIQDAVNAKDAAEAAKEEALQYQSGAESAHAMALEERQKAEAAEKNAEEARGAAEEARSQAATACDEAQDARNDAVSAKEAAEEAQKNTEEAESRALEYESGAESAQHQAEGNAVFANDARIAAEAARDDILNMTVSSEQLSSDAEPNVTKTERGGSVNLHFGIPEGEKGDTGSSGVYIGTDAPTDPDVNVWIDPDGEESDLRGPSAYEVAVKNGFVGTEAEWLASLKGDKGDTGEKGDKGDTGLNGEKGDTGETGASAYEIATQNGFVGTEEEFAAIFTKMQNVEIAQDQIILRDKEYGTTMAKLKVSDANVNFKMYESISEDTDYVNINLSAGDLTSLLFTVCTNGQKKFYKISATEMN